MKFKPLRLFMEFFLGEDPPYVITSVDGVEGSVEDVLNAKGFTVGMNWCCSAPEQQQEDGRWKLYVTPLAENERDHNRLVMSDLIRSADIGTFSFGDWEGTGEDMAQQVERGTNLGRQYAIDLLKVSRDIMRRKAKKG